MQVIDMTSKQTNTLTKIFKQLSDIDDVKESLGSQILAFLVENKCKTLAQANEQFGIAYDENGWKRHAGRPRDGATDIPAPSTVKNYVNYFRRAYEAGLDVLRFKTVGEMRVAVSEMRAAQREMREQPASLVGVQVSKEDVLTGGLVHDICALIKNLPEEQREEFEAKLRRAAAPYMKKAPPELRLVA